MNANIHLACRLFKEFGAAAAAAAKAHLDSKNSHKARDLIELLLMARGARYPFTGLSKDGGKGRERVRSKWRGGGGVRQRRRRRRRGVMMRWRIIEMDR